MIVDFFLNAIRVTLEFAIGYLPAYTGLPSGMETAINFVGQSLMTVSEWIPLDTLVQYFLYVVYIEIGISLFRLLAWIFHWNQANPNP